MKRLFALLFISLLYSQSFAYNLLQVTIETDQTPPPPQGDGPAGIMPTAIGVPGAPIEFIVPFLLISVFFLILYIKKKRIKAI